MYLFQEPMPTVINGVNKYYIYSVVQKISSYTKELIVASSSFVVYFFSIKKQDSKYVYILNRCLLIE